MDKPKRMITENLERKAFEKIIHDVFSKYKDNLMCSQSILDSIIKDSTEQIRQQLQGVSRDYILK
jgi:hypothetical protein